MARLPEVTREALPDELRATFDELIEANDGKMPIGPGSVAINSPELARRRGPLNSYLRFETSIPPAVLELAILTTARCLDCPYVWNAHVPMARRAGVTDEVIQAIRDDAPLPATGAGETAVVQYARELFKNHVVGDETFRTALDEFGPLHLVEITAVLGLYAQNAFLVNAFAVDLPSERAEPQLQGHSP